MNCPDCQSEMRVWRTTPAGTAKKPATVREHRCPCGQQFVSEDRITRRLTAISSNRGPVKEPYTVPKPTVKGTQTEVLGDPNVQKGGLGVSDLGLSGLNSQTGSLSDLRLDHSQEVDPAREAEPKYPIAFELVWRVTGKRGLKGKAFKAWKKAGKPTADAIGARWSAYLLSERPVAGFVLDLSTWLNGDGHTQDWQPAKVTRAAAQPPRQPGPSITDIELAATRARQSAEREAQKQAEKAEQFRLEQQRERDAGGTT